MEYYVSKKAGSIMFRKPHKRHLKAGDHIPHEVWDNVVPGNQAELLKTGMVEMFEDPDSVKLSEPQPEQLPKVGVGRDKFMPEATVQPGDRKDDKLQALVREQQERAQQAQRASEVDEEAGGSEDGVVKVELPPEVDEDDESDDDMTDEERETIEQMEREDQQEND